jgi:hypothetical protein
MGLAKRTVERLEDRIDEHFFLLAAIVGVFLVAALSLLLFWGS